MATGWNETIPDDAAWRPPTGMSTAYRAAEQDTAAGSRERRIIAIGEGRAVLGSIYLRLPPRSRRVYAYLRWADGRKTRERYICQVDGTSREANLAQGWVAVAQKGLIAQAPSGSWATSTAVSSVMRGNRGRDTKPEKAVRTAVHAIGMRYRICRPPVAGLRRTADMVFTGPKIAVFIDGCFWHGCPDHHRPANRNKEFWTEKITATRTRDQHTDALLNAAGWTVIRVWEHEDPTVAANRISTAVLKAAPSRTDTSPGRDH